MNMRTLLIPALLASLAGSAGSLARADNNQADPKQHTRRALEANPKALWDPEVIFVRFRDEASEDSIRYVRSIVGGTTVEKYWLVPGLETLHVTGDIFDAIDLLSIFPSVVEYAEPDYIVHHCATPNDPSFGQLWGLNNTGQTVNGDPGIANADINGPQAWDAFTGDPNFIIADIDTGVNYNHPDLSANAWLNTGEIAGNGIDDDGNGRVDDLRGWDFFNNDANPIDDNGHGTHTAGTFGARGNNGVGIAGVNWQCKIMALKFLGASGSGSSSGALGCLQYAVQKNVKVSNNSWGGGPASTPLQTAITNSQSIGHIFCAAAGNNGSNNNTSAFYPASYTSANIIAVLSTTNNDTRSSFSNYGSTTVDIGAPGSTIYSTYNNSYTFLDGTSMACPHVAGVVGLVYGANPGWTWQQVRDRILQTARPVASLSGFCATGSIVNAQAAVTPAGPPTPPAAPSGINAFENGYGNARITWTDNAFNETSFGIERQKKTAGVWGATTNFSAATNATSFQQVANSVLRYQVRATNAVGSSAWTGYAVVRPQAPAAAFIADMVNLTVTLNWVDGSAFEEGFRVERQQFVGGVWTNTTTFTRPANSLNFVNTVPAAGDYRYRVQAYSESQSSVFTNYTEVYAE